MRKTFDFSGRSSRSEFWIYAFIVGTVGFVLGFIEGMLWGIPVLSFLFSLALSITGFSVMVRRLHDMGRSGWWVLLNFTVIGALIPLVFALAGSDPHTNQFGSPPRSSKGRRQGGRTKTELEKTEQAAVFPSCGSCGKRMVPGTNFCANCGAPNDR